MQFLSPSPWLYTAIKNFELFRPTAYRPTSRDVWTIAWGHTLGVKEGDVCDMAQGELWLQDDVRPAAQAVNQHVTVALTQNQFDALVDFAFNCGVGAFEESTLLRLLNDGSYSGASNEFLRWDRQAGQILSGLLTRRTAEQARFNTPD